MYKKFQKMHNMTMKKILYIILIFIVSVGVGYYYSSVWMNNKEEMSKTENNQIENKIVETISEEEKVLYSANFTIKKFYDECGHYKIQEAELPTELINLTQDEISNLYTGWNVEEFSKDNVVLFQEVNSICDEHYILKLGEKNIEIFHLENSGELKLFKTTNISKEYLAVEDIKNLEKGIYIYGIANLNSAIEDFE